MDEAAPPEKVRATYATERLATIREDISTRLWRVTAGMNSGRFNALIEDMARVQFDGERRVHAGDRRFALRIDDVPRRR